MNDASLTPNVQVAYTPVFVVTAASYNLPTVRANRYLVAMFTKQVQILLPILVFDSEPLYLHPRQVQ